MSLARTLIVGIGSSHGDDEAGWLVAARLAVELECGDVKVRRASSPAELLNWLSGIDWLIVCDACCGLGNVGEVRCWTWPTRELLDASWTGTHDLSLPAVLQLASRLGHLPPRVAIWSVEAAVCSTMTRMSCEVTAALPRISDEIAKEVNEVIRCTNNHLSELC